MGGLYYAGVFAALMAILAGIALFATLWMRLVYGVAAHLVRTAYRLGLYSPERRTAAPAGRKDRGIIGFSRLLRAVNVRLPRRSHDDPLALVATVFVVGLPLLLFLLVVVWALPLTMFGWVLANSPEPWAALLSFGGLFAYVVVFLTVYRLGLRAARLLRTGRGRWE